jgi:hypothetical protein
MNRKRFGRTAIRSLLGLSLVLAMGFPILWPTPAQAQGEGWEWQNPLPQGNDLFGVWGSSGSDVFAVGYGGTILHYDGAGPSLMPSGTYAYLYGVWGSSGSDIFAVGSGGSIVHYDGTAWTPMSSGMGNYLYGVWGSSGSDVIAVGEGGTILHYSGEPHRIYLPLVLKHHTP